MLRIISGKFKNHFVESPPLEIVRPSTEKVREAIFDMIQFDIEQAIVADLFAGSGIFSFEFISRGAMKVFSIEKNYKIFNLIKKNIEKFKVNNIDAINTDALNFISHANGKKFDFIFMDAPYDNYDLVNEIIAKIFKEDLLNPEGRIIVETNDKNKIIVPQPGMITKEKKYGKTFVLFLNKIL
ncbi:16S rRNA (guanine(966)-N(2))-methyltransferase RsmD [[Mycoplasma] mobile]|uniref:N6-adenine-specific methylase n=1 Tax=Mycoplasma mobile (strain ATCC 43663 / 163K / NCTC 11711) TaxID=267748 RepID=Q6KH88_MYCM1|nr:16S rRNA (guanine(966)-N(2))-methyltransferase RsmD [[Mycoplasma] mobile]AAT28042.1 N6-adenine-specific methylase [Mycoplasma mobile 163K]